LPTELIESELFGHEKGAFTGAAFKRVGKFEAADGGTLFLDEVGDMSLTTQAKVLRIMEEKSFERLGSNQVVKADVRIVSATNKRLEAEIAAERFREDLYYRLCVVKLELPPLRDRSSDIITLAETFSRRFSVAYGLQPLRINRDAAQALLSYNWPGNVRELRNCIERAVVLAENGDITVKSLPEQTLRKSISENEVTGNSLAIDFTSDFKADRRQFEKRYIERCLELSGGNITRAASMLGMHRQSLQHKMRELGLQKRFTS
jgi:DNA-binding NtrC family response regulator